MEEDDQVSVVEGAGQVEAKGRAVVFYGRMWYDDNKNSMMDDGEAGVKGAKVWLYRYRKTSDGRKTFVKVKSRTTKNDGSFELPLKTIAGNSEYYLKFVHSQTAHYEFAPVIKGGDNEVTKRGNSKRRVVEYGMTYEVNAGLIAKSIGAVPFRRLAQDAPC